MPNLPYLVRRAGGRYYFQMRMPVAGNWPALVRFSLFTSDPDEARRALLRTLTWIMPLRDAPSVAERAQAICDRLQAYKTEGRARTPEQVTERQRYHELNERFVEQASSLGLESTPLIALQLAWERFDGMLFRDQIDLERRGPNLPPMPRPTELWDDSSPSETITPAPTGKAPEPPTLVSGLLREFLAERRRTDDNDKAVGDVGIYVEFMIAMLGDRPLNRFSQADMDSLAEACKSVPKPTGLPPEAKASIRAQFDYAANHGSGLTLLGENTLKNRYEAGVNRFLKWAKGKRHLDKTLTFTINLDRNSANTVPLERDSFRLDEIEQLLQMPTFTGHLAETRWEPGSFLNQDYIYWAYIFLLTTGMRQAELGQLAINDFVEDGGYFFVRIRAFDPEKGRVARRDAKQHKTANAARCVPLDLLVLDLGFMDRVQELRAWGVDRVFPDWRSYVDPRGATHWSTPISRDWDERKKKLGITRKNVSPCSARHSFGDRLDKLHISERLRNRVMGHAAKGAPGVYGASGVSDPSLLTSFNNLRRPTSQRCGRYSSQRSKRHGKADVFSSLGCRATTVPDHPLPGGRRVVLVLAFAPRYRLFDLQPSPVLHLASPDPRLTATQRCAPWGTNFRAPARRYRRDERGHSPLPASRRAIRVPVPPAAGERLQLCRRERRKMRLLQLIGRHQHHARVTTRRR